jgi:hypothetical protein
VDGSRQRALARARLTRDENRRHGIRDARCNVEHPEHGGATSDEAPEADRVAKNGTKASRFVAQPSLVDRAPQKKRKLVESERLREVVVGPSTYRIDRRLDGPVSGHHDDRSIRRELARKGQQGHAVHVRHPKIRDECIEGVGAEPLRGGAARGARNGLVAPIRESFGERLRQVYLVVDD